MALVTIYACITAFQNRWYSASFKKFITSQFGEDAYRVGNETGGMSGDLPGFMKREAAEPDAPAVADTTKEETKVAV